MKLPVVCPSCESTLIVSQMKCTNCDTTVNGNYELPCIFSLVVRNNNLSLIFSIQRKYKGDEQTG